MSVCARCSGTGVEPVRAPSRADIRVVGRYQIGLFKRHQGWLLEIREIFETGIQRARFRREAEARALFERIQGLAELKRFMAVLRRRPE